MRPSGGRRGPLSRPVLVASLLSLAGCGGAGAWWLDPSSLLCVGRVGVGGVGERRASSAPDFLDWVDAGLSSLCCSRRMSSPSRCS